MYSPQLSFYLSQVVIKQKFEKVKEKHWGKTGDSSLDSDNSWGWWVTNVVGFVFKPLSPFM